MTDKKILKLLKGLELEDLWCYKYTDILEKTKNVQVLKTNEDGITEDKEVEMPKTLEDREKELKAVVDAHNRLCDVIRKTQQYYKILVDIFTEEEEE